MVEKRGGMQPWRGALAEAPSRTYGSTASAGKSRFSGGERNGGGIIYILLKMCLARPHPANRGGRCEAGGGRGLSLLQVLEHYVHGGRQPQALVPAKVGWLAREVLSYPSHLAMQALALALGLALALVPVPAIDLLCSCLRRASLQLALALALAALLPPLPPHIRSLSC